jgi:hypothetical protein
VAALKKQHEQAAAQLADPDIYANKVLYKTAENELQAVSGKLAAAQTASEQAFEKLMELEDA